jgi:hypothetical protein
MLTLLEKKILVGLHDSLFEKKNFWLVFMTACLKKKISGWSS